MADNPLRLFPKNGTLLDHLYYSQMESSVGGVLARASMSKMAGVEWVKGHFREGKYVPGYRREEAERKPAKKEFAPGLPSKKRITPFPRIPEDRSQIWEFGVHDHHAVKAGRHFDLRLGDPATDIAHSWAIPKAKLPEPGEKLLAVRQPDHTVAYMNFKGMLPEGYGYGKVDLHKRGKTEITFSSEDMVKFNLYEGREISEFVLIRTGGPTKWLLQNVTPTRQSRPDLPSSKPKYKETKPEKIDLGRESEILQAKVDGAHVLVDLKPGKQTRVFSYRPTERKTGVIDHTQRIPGVLGHRGDKETGDTILRGEVYATGKDGKAVPSQDVGGMLNANVWKSRLLQGEKGPLTTAIFDVVKYKGKPAEDLPYSEKLRILKEISEREGDLFHLPDMAETREEKEKLYKDIQEGKHKQTSEGVIVWDKNKPGPTKAKHRPDFDVYVRKIYPGHSKGGSELDRAGGFDYSWTPDGPIVGRVGSGFDHKLLRDMKASPDKYVGRVAKVRSQEKMPGKGALRSPSFSEWHLDKTAGKIKEYLKVWARHGALNAGQAARDIRYIHDYPRTKGLRGSIKKRLASLRNNIKYTIAPPTELKVGKHTIMKGHHTLAELKREMKGSPKEYFLWRYKPWKYPNPDKTKTAAAWTPSKIHRIADKLGIAWDDDPKFKKFSEEITGVSCLDKMSSSQRKDLATALLRRVAGGGGGLNKTASTAFKLYQIAKKVGVEPAPGTDWRWLAKMLKKGKVKPEDLASPSAKMRQATASYPKVEHGEVWAPGKGRTYVKGEPGRNLSIDLSGGPEQARRASTVHSHPTGGSTEDALRSAKQFEGLASSPEVKPGGRQLFSGLAKRFRTSTSPGSLPSFGDLGAPGGFLSQRASGLFQGIYHPKTGRVGQYRVTGPRTFTEAELVGKKGGLREAYGTRVRHVISKESAALDNPPARVLSQLLQKSDAKERKAVKDKEKKSSMSGQDFMGFVGGLRSSRNGNGVLQDQNDIPYTLDNKLAGLKKNPFAPQVRRTMLENKAKLQLKKKIQRKLESSRATARQGQRFNPRSIYGPDAHTGNIKI